MGTVEFVPSIHHQTGDHYAPTFFRETGAGEGARTLDTQLGKLVLYHLSYARAPYRITVKNPKGKPNVRA